MTRNMMVMVLLMVVALAGVVAAQTPEDIARAEAAVNGFSKVWDTWPPIKGFDSVARGRGPDGSPVPIGTAKGVHTNITEDNHVDAILVYPFGGTELAYVKVSTKYFEVYALRGEDGKFAVVQGGQLTAAVNEKGETVSFTITYTLANGTEGSRTYTNPKAKQST
jgi:hypothetical protein